MQCSTQIIFCIWMSKFKVGISWSPKLGYQPKKYKSCTLVQSMILPESSYRRQCKKVKTKNLCRSEEQHFFTRLKIIDSLRRKFRPWIVTKCLDIFSLQLWSLFFPLTLCAVAEHVKKSHSCSLTWLQKEKSSIERRKKSCSSIEMWWTGYFKSIQLQRCRSIPCEKVSI